MRLIKQPIVYRLKCMELMDGLTQIQSKQRKHTAHIPDGEIWDQIYVDDPTTPQQVCRHQFAPWYFKGRKSGLLISVRESVPVYIAFYGRHNCRDANDPRKCAIVTLYNPDSDSYRHRNIPGTLIPFIMSNDTKFLGRAKAIMQAVGVWGSGYYSDWEVNFHHVDNDPYNNAPENILCVCSGLHKCLHDRREHYYDRIMAQVKHAADAEQLINQFKAYKQIIITSKNNSI